jgi:hypothetical protein
MKAQGVRYYALIMDTQITYREFISTENEEMVAADLSS